MPGEVVAVIGPNGAGKTTLLEVMVGLRDPSSASVLLHGRTLRTFSERARAFSYLPDMVELPPEVRIRALIEHVLACRSRPTRLVDELRVMLEIPKLFDIPTGALSRGERQRLALFCALAVDRPVVVLDEPFNAFDPLQLRCVLEAVRRVADEGAAIVTTVHQLGDAQKSARRFLLLSEGRRVAWGDIDSLRSEANLPEGQLEEIFIALLERGAHAA